MESNLDDNEYMVKYNHTKELISLDSIHEYIKKKYDQYIELDELKHHIGLMNTYIYCYNDDDTCEIINGKKLENIYDGYENVLIRYRKLNNNTYEKNIKLCINDLNVDFKNQYKYNGNIDSRHICSINGKDITNKDLILCKSKIPDVLSSLLTNKEKKQRHNIQSNYSRK